MAKTVEFEMMLLTFILVFNGMETLAYGSVPPELLSRSSKIGFYCSERDNVVVGFAGNSKQDEPRIHGLTKAGLCERRLDGHNAELLCEQYDGLVSLIIEYDDQDLYNLAKVSCPQRSRERREFFEVAARLDNIDLKDVHAGNKEPTMGKANAKMEIGLKYNNISEIEISCHPTGQVYLTNPDTSIYNYMFSYNSNGEKCVTLELSEDIVEISNCNQEEIIEIAFSPFVFRDNIIGGKGKPIVYKLNCTEIGTDHDFFRQRVLGLHENASGLVTWSINVICVIAGLRSFIMTSLLP